MREPDAGRVTQLSQRKPHHQPRAHRRGLFAQAHNLLWVTAARRILVA
jgi:hypothetical protein